MLTAETIVEDERRVHRDTLIPAAAIEAAGPILTTLSVNKWNHIFNNPEHQLEPLVKKLGGPQKVFDAVQTALNDLDLPIASSVKSLM